MCEGFGRQHGYYRRINDPQRRPLRVRHDRHVQCRPCCAEATASQGSCDGMRPCSQGLVRIRCSARSIGGTRHGSRSADLSREGAIPRPSWRRRRASCKWCPSLAARRPGGDMGSVQHAASNRGSHFLPGRMVSVRMDAASCFTECTLPANDRQSALDIRHLVSRVRSRRWRHPLGIDSRTQSNCVAVLGSGAEQATVAGRPGMTAANTWAGRWTRGSVRFALDPVLA